MSKQNSPQIVTIDNVEYDANEFTQEQSILFQHCVDLDRKIGSTNFQMQQLQVGKDSFLQMLKKSLETQPVEAAVN
jgi:hypothetical protein